MLRCYDKVSFKVKVRSFTSKRFYTSSIQCAIHFCKKTRSHFLNFLLPYFYLIVSLFVIFVLSIAMLIILRLLVYHVWNKIESSTVLSYFHNDMLILFWNCFKVESRPAPIKYKSLRGHVWLENSSFPVKRICNYKFIACISKCFLRFCCYLSKTLEMAFLQSYHLSASCLDYRRVSDSIGLVDLSKILSHLYYL